MDIDLIKEVKDVEQEADKIFTNAEKQGQDKLTEITGQSKKLISETKDKLKQSVKSKLTEAKIEAENKAKQIEQNTLTEIQHLQARDNTITEKAINIIIENLDKQIKSNL